MIKTKLCDMMGIRYPIIQAGMGPFGTNQLCIASSNAGTLGLISSSGLVMKTFVPSIYRYFCETGGALEQDDLPTALKKIIKNTSRGITLPGAGYGINVMVSAELAEYAKQIVDTMMQTREEDPAVKQQLKVIVTSAGDPLPWTDIIKKSGMTWCHVVSSVKAAKRCQKAGVDCIIASGHEGGFHTSWEPVHSIVLLPAVVEAVPNIPVVGTGGFCDGRTLVAALAMGAVGIQMGTRFLATKECDFPQLWKDQVVKADDRSTLIARGIVGPARFLKTAYAEQHAENSLKGSPGVFLGKPDDLASIPQELLNTELNALESVYSGKEEKALFPAGECAQRIHDMPTVREMVESVMAEAENTLKALPGQFLR